MSHQDCRDENIHKHFFIKWKRRRRKEIRGEQTVHEMKNGCETKP